MPSSRQFNNMSGAEQQTRPTEAAEDITDTRSAPGFAPWITSTAPTFGGHLAQMSKYNTETGAFSHSVTIHDSHAFELEPLTITDGPLRGSHVLVLKPYTKYFQLLKLPLDIRRMIYDELLLDPEPIDITTYKPKGAPRHAVSYQLAFRREIGSWNSETRKFQFRTTNNIGVMQVNRQIRQEASTAVYGGNTFRFDKFNTCQLFFARLGDIRCHIRHIEFFADAYQKTKSRGMFLELKNVKRMRTIEISYREFDDLLAGGPHIWTAEQLAADCKIMMTALHEFRQGRSNLPSVLELIKVTWSICTSCAKAKKGEGESNVACSKCTEIREAGKATQKRVRTAIAATMGIEQ